MKTTKRPSTRPKARPVLQFRVHPDLYSALAKAARANKISISQEAESRIRESFGSSLKRHPDRGSAIGLALAADR
jgi:predicted HicB family RNase H-like nuclease